MILYHDFFPMQVRQPQFCLFKFANFVSSPNLTQPDPTPPTQLRTGWRTCMVGKLECGNWYWAKDPADPIWPLQQKNDPTLLGPITKFIGLE